MNVLSSRRQGPASAHIVFVVLVWSALTLVGCGTATQQGSGASDSGDTLERTAEKGPVRMVVRVHPREPRLSDLLEMTVTVTAPAGVDIKAPAFGQAVGDFLVRDYTERSDSKPKSPSADTAQERRFEYKLEPVSAGRHLIRSLEIEFADNRPNSEQQGVRNFVESEPLEVNVTSEMGDQVPDLAQLEPMLPPRPLTSSWGWGWWVGLGMFCVVVTTGGVLWWRRRHRTQIDEPLRKTPEEIAHAAIAQLLAENLPAQGQLKEFYLRLTGLVRHFIEDTTGLHAPDQTTEEFLRVMRSGDFFTAERSVRLQEFLEAADMVKFAGQHPDNDQIELSTTRAREFVGYRQAVGPKTEDSAASVVSGSPVGEEH